MSGVNVTGSVAGSQSVHISVIIPTYNRSELLQITLNSLQKQQYPAECIDAWVIDDGSTEDIAQVVKAVPGSIPVTYVRQPNSGATAARNTGAGQASGEVLVFADDDIELMPDAIPNLVQGLYQIKHSVIVGTLLASGQLESTGGLDVADSDASDDLIKIPIGKCFTGLLAVIREDFLTLGMFQDPTGGWPNWDDVDFGYRAFQAGYDLRRCRTAKAIHHDSAATSLAAAAQRWYRAGFSSVRLFQRHPGIYKQLPMFHDKTPIRWGRDSASLVIRKLARRFASSSVLQQILTRMETLNFVQTLLPSLADSMRRWIVSGQVFQGIRQGIKEYGDFPE